MTTAWEHRSSERTEIRKETEYWSIQSDGYDIVITRGDRDFGNSWEIAVASYHGSARQLPLLKFYPRHVADLEAIAQALPSLLGAAAAKLRDMGEDDLRSEFERRMDETWGGSWLRRNASRKDGGGELIGSAALAPPDLPRAFPRCELTDAQWDALPVSVVPIESLVPSQEGISLYHLTALLNAETDHAHVGRAIYWQDRLNLYDGHHHWIVAAARGEQTFRVRIYVARTEAGE